MQAFNLAIRRFVSSSPSSGQPIPLMHLLRKLNDAVVKSNRSDLKKALKEVSSKLQTPVCLDDVSLYMILFKKCLEENHSDDFELWLEDIESVARTVVLEVVEVRNACTFLRQINAALDRNDTLSVIKGVRALDIKVSDRDGERLIESIKNIKRHRVCKIH